MTRRIMIGMRSLLPLLLLVALVVPAFAESPAMPEYDPSVPYPLTPIDLQTADMDACLAWLNPVVASYGRLRIQYPVDNVWYYTTYEKNLSYGGDTLSIADTTTVGVKAGGPLPDPKLYTAVKLTDIDPASIKVTEIVPFTEILGEKSTLGKDKGTYAATWAQYVLPAWFIERKPATEKVWKLTFSANEGKKLFAQVHYGPSNVEPPNVKTLMDGVSAVGLYFTDKTAAEQSAKVLGRMVEISGAE